MASEQVIPLVDPFTGIAWDTSVRIQEDACWDCGGNGVVRFSTFADLRKYVEAKKRWIDSDYNDEWNEEPERSGSRYCDRCGGTGVKEGDGGRIRYSMSLKMDLFSLPKDMFK